MKAAIFRHTILDSLGSLEKTLNRSNVTYDIIDTFHEDFSDFDPNQPDILIVLGGPMGVYQADDYPFLKQEISILKQRLEKDRPTLGLCLGAQLIAKALGSDIYPGKQGKERGWFPLSVNEAGLKTPMRYLDASQTNMLHWHGDTFDLPHHCCLLASSAQYENQAFSYKKNTLALQSHPEITPYMLDNWLVHAAALIAEKTINPKKIRQDTHKYAAILESQTDLFLTEWIKSNA